VVIALLLPVVLASVWLLLRRARHRTAHDSLDR